MRPIQHVCRTAAVRDWWFVVRNPQRRSVWKFSKALTTAPKSTPTARARSVAHRNAYSTRYEDPTIYALSSATGRAAIAVIRISGPACLDIYRAICPGKKIPKPRMAAVHTLYQPKELPSRETVLDSSALILHFPCPATATGEDILEFHVHGGPAVVKAVLAAISNCDDSQQSRIRYAEPGEFTRRAFMNNRLDLTQVEALGDTLSADTEQQRRLSIRGTTGSLAKRYEDWRQQLLYARGELEALIDFSEDQHFDESPSELCASVAQQILALKHTLSIHSQNAVRGELLRHGISVSLLGPPNAGKSSLLNRIVGREAAIVSHEAGTTRDVVEIGLDLGGYFCRFGDTAGLRQAKAAAQSGQSPAEVVNHIEREGMRRAKARAAESDLVIAVLGFETINNHTAVAFDAEVCAVANLLHQEKENVLLVINKSDLLPAEDVQREHAVREALHHFPGLARDRIHMVSCIDTSFNTLDPTRVQSSDPGEIQTFLQGLIQQFGRLTAAVTSESAADEPDPSVWQESLGASERHRVLLDACISHLDAFLAETLPSSTAASQRYHCGPAAGTHGAKPTEDAGVDSEADIVVAAEHLRSAADCLAKITGRGDAGDVNEVLGVVFEKFCVGK